MYIYEIDNGSVRLKQCHHESRGSKEETAEEETSDGHLRIGEGGP